MGRLRSAQEDTRNISTIKMAAAKTLLLAVCLVVFSTALIQAADNSADDQWNFWTKVCKNPDYNCYTNGAKRTIQADIRRGGYCKIFCEGSLGDKICTKYSEWRRGEVYRCEMWMNKI